VPNVFQENAECKYILHLNSCCSSSKAAASVANTGKGAKGAASLVARHLKLEFATTATAAAVGPNRTERLAMMKVIYVRQRQCSSAPRRHETRCLAWQQLHLGQETCLWAATALQQCCPHPVIKDKKRVGNGGG